MKKLLTFLVALGLVAPGLVAPGIFAQDQGISTLALGWFPYNWEGAMTSTTLNAAGTWRAFSKVVAENLTLNEVSLYVSGVTGTPDGTEITLTLYGDASGLPDSGGSVIDGPRNLGAGTVTTGWKRWTGFTAALTAGTRYWVVAKNTNGSPASNYVIISYAASTMSDAHFLGNGNGPTLWTKMSRGTTDSGANWATSLVYGNGSIRFGWSNATYSGFAIQSSGNETTNRVFGSNEFGVLFTTPANAKVKVRCVALQVQAKTGNPGTLSYKLYEGTSLLGTTIAIPQVNAGVYWDLACFTSAFTLNANTAHRLVAKASSGDSSNYYQFYGFTFDSDSNSTGLKPLGSSITYWNGSSWIDTTTRIQPFVLVGDTSGPFGASASGGGSYTFVQ